VSCLVDPEANMRIRYGRGMMVREQFRLAVRYGNSPWSVARSFYDQVGDWYVSCKVDLEARRYGSGGLEQLD
jgi:hypothetical protein